MFSFAHQNYGERYYLRLLLTKVHGATCFEHICTIPGVLHPIFRSAYLALGLLDNDGELHDDLNEASIKVLGIQMRNMFCSKLMLSKIADAIKL